MKVKYLAHELEEKIVDGKLIKECIEYRFQQNELFIIIKRFYSKIESDLLGKDPLKTEVVCEHFSFEGLEDGTWELASLDTSFYLQPILDVFIKDGVLHITLLQNQPEQELNVWIEPDSSDSINKSKYKKATFEWINKAKLLSLRKENKKKELSSRCEESILSGFDIEIESETYRISYDREAQTNLQERWSLFENNMIESIMMTFHKGEEAIRLPVDKQEFAQIYLASVKAKEDKISRLRDVLYPIVDESLSIEQLDSISWDSEVVLPEEPSVIFDDSNTIEKQINKTNQQVQQTNQKLSMTNSGLLELTLLTMMGGS